MSEPTFAALLAGQLRRAGSRPLVTFYDDATGERVELSVVTYANWVAKTAGLLQDELGAERGDRLLVDLPTHWLGPVWLGAAWSLGVSVTSSRTAIADAAVVVCGPDRLEEHAAAGARRGIPVVALSLLPMAARFAAPLPDGVVDYGAVVWGQPDTFLADDEPGPEDAAWVGDRDDLGTLSQQELLRGAAASGFSAPGTRLLTDVNPCTAAGLTTLTGPLLGGGGTVWVRHPDASGWEHRATSEQATTVSRRGRSRRTGRR